MDLQELKKQFVCEELGITDVYGRIIAFVDYGNVNYWFSDDRQTHDILEPTQYRVPTSYM